MPPAPSSSTAISAILPLIQSGDAYSAHQKARTFASRYLKAKQYPVAIDVLFQSARELFKAGELGSGTDLGVFLVDAYELSGESLTGESRGRLTQLIALAGSEGGWRETLVGKAIAWSAKASGCPAGEPDLHHYIGELYYKEGAFIQAETHYLASGTRDSAKQLANLLFEWSRGGGEPGKYAARGTIPYLITTNVLAARVFLSTFLSLIISSQPNILAQQASIAISTSSPASDEIFATTDQTLNFLQLAVRVCQRADPSGNDPKASRDARNAWTRLCGRYTGGLGGTVQGGNVLVAGGPNMKEAVMGLSQIYFNIQPPRGAANPLQDMMASFFGGAPGGEASGAPKLAIGPGRGRGRGVGDKADMNLD